MQTVCDNIIYVKISKYRAKVGTGTSSHNGVENIDILNNHVVLNDAIVIGGRKLTVTNLACYSFCQLTNLKSIVIPNTIEIIEDCVFWMSSGLEKVEFIPGSRVRSIGLKFFDHTVVSQLVLPATIQSLSNDFIYNVFCDIEITYCGSAAITNSVFGGEYQNIKINVHEGYKGTTFGGKPVTVSNSFVCPSVVYQNKFTRRCSFVSRCRSSRLMHSLFCLISIS